MLSVTFNPVVNCYLYFEIKDIVSPAMFIKVPTVICDVRIASLIESIDHSRNNLVDKPKIY